MDQDLLNWKSSTNRKERLGNKHWNITCVTSKNTIRKAVFRCGKTRVGIDSATDGRFVLLWESKGTIPLSELLFVFTVYVCIMWSEWKIAKYLVSDPRGISFCSPLTLFQYSKPGRRLLLRTAKDSSRYTVFCNPTCLIQLGESWGKGACSTPQYTAYFSD